MTFFLTYSECVFGKNKRLKILYFVNFQPFEMRSEGDSNPRAACDDYTLSRRASSTTRASLLDYIVAKIIIICVASKPLMGYVFAYKCALFL